MAKDHNIAKQMSKEISLSVFPPRTENGTLRCFVGTVIISLQQCLLGAKKKLVYWYYWEQEGANGLEDMKIWRFAHVNVTMWPALPVNKKAGEHMQRVVMLCVILNSVTKAAKFVWWAESCTELLSELFPNYFKAEFNCKLASSAKSHPPSCLIGHVHR